jgi:hypothetical protein
MGLVEAIRTGKEGTSPLSGIINSLDRQQKERMEREKQELESKHQKQLETHKALLDIFKSKQEAKSKIESQKETFKGLEQYLGDKNGEGLPEGVSIKIGDVTLTGKAPKKYGETESQTLNYADTLSQDIDEIISILDDPESKKAQFTSMIPSILGITPEAFGNIKGQAFKLLNQRISQSLIYMRSGKQINKEEYLRFKDMLAKFSRADTLDKENMNKLKEEMARVSGRIKEGKLWDEKEKKFTAKDESVPAPRTGKLSNGMTFTY